MEFMPHKYIFLQVLGEKTDTLEKTHFFCGLMRGELGWAMGFAGPGDQFMECQPPIFIH